MVRPAEGLDLAARVVLAAGNMMRTPDTEEASAKAKAGAVASAEARAGVSAADGARAGAGAAAWDNPSSRDRETALSGNKHPFVLRNARKGKSFGLNKFR